MKILIAPDSFKECLSAFAVTEALSVGLRRSGVPDSSLLCRPLADGGEGFLDVLHHALGGEIDTVCVSGPMGNPVSARYGLLDSGRTAVIEMAEAAGVHLLPVEGRNPGVTTTRGVGELIKHVLDLGVQRILVGLGGSVTNDGGTGMAAALGACFKDADGKPLAPGGAALHHLVEVDLSGFDKRLQTVEVVGACDVLNTLCGDKGASFVYGPQKGASPKEVQQLDEALYHYAAVVKKQMGVEVLSLAGGGAAGGLAAGLALFAGATLRSGAELVFEAYGDMEESIGSASIIISGEGAVDG
ncbi:MAG: glycerate kinase, partial [Candidatus Hydrogenedentes bacterium]|nr:glycerate kinase [Candidatus Hydrogenedentota bacterium]